MVWLAPALAFVGFASARILMVAVEAGQMPFVIVHCKILLPVLKPFTEVFAEEGEEMNPLPETTLQLPVPTEGTFAAREVVLPQICWLLPALAAAGFASARMLTVAVEAGQMPFFIVHMKALFPVPRLLTEVVASVAEAIMPLPETTVQLAVPTAGVFPLSVTELPQMCWLLPAFEAVGERSRLI